jgi:chemotaxis protein methyltransferase CheR
MLTDEEFRLFSNLIYEESGIYFKETRKDFLENRLIKRMTATGMKSPYWYYKFVTEKSNTELLVLLDLLTINETSFFRNRPQIDLFKNVVLPDIMNKKRQNPPSPSFTKGGMGRLRVWSAGCSTGEEPYSIAMVVHDAMNNAPSYPSLKLRGGRGSYDGGFEWDIKIFASDLSLTALEIANSGEYPADKVHATVDDYYINKYFERIPPSCHSHESGNPEKKQKTGFPLNNCGNDEICRGLRSGEGVFSEQKFYKVKDEVKKMIIFDFHNLKNENGLQNLDVILCRNVMIYFDEEEQRRLIEKLYRKLNPGGFLLLGHAESLHGWNTGFQFVYKDKGTAYKKAEEI